MAKEINIDGISKAAESIIEAIQGLPTSDAMTAITIATASIVSDVTQTTEQRQAAADMIGRQVFMVATRMSEDDTEEVEEPASQH